MPTLRPFYSLLLRNFGLISALLLTACQPAEPDVRPVTPTAPAGTPAPQAPTPAAMLARFEADLKACQALVGALASDRAFVESFQSAKVTGF